jgi:hypothetical protein
MDGGRLETSGGVASIPVSPPGTSHEVEIELG